MAISRRHFLQAASITVLAGTALPGALAQRGHGFSDDTFSPDRMAIFNGVSSQTFKSLIGEEFMASKGGKSLGALTLIEVNSGDRATPAKGNIARPMVGMVPRLPSEATNMFTLRFQRSGDQLSQDTYTLDHPALGPFPLFLVPAGPGATPYTHTAVFSQLIAGTKA